MAAPKKGRKTEEARPPLTGTGGVRRPPGLDDGLTVVRRDELIPWPNLNPRTRFDAAELAELRVTIEQDGILQPLGVRLMPEPPHWIWAGERRWRASEGLLDELPCITRDIGEAAAHRLALSENLQRSDLSPVEEAWGIERYMAAVGAEGHGVMTQTMVADEVGRSQAWVANRLRLLKLPAALLELIQLGQLSGTQARDLILPFATLPAALWTRLSDSVAKALTKMAKQRTEAFSDEEVRAQVSKVAVAMSSWLDVPLYGLYAEDTSEGWGTGIRIPKEHWPSAPTGTVIAYEYGVYRDRSSRAFDHEWWATEMLAEEARFAVEQKRLGVGVDEADEASADLDWSPELGVIGADVKVPYQRRHVVCEASRDDAWYRDALGRVGQDGGAAGLYADPTLIPSDALVVQEAERGRLAILCTRADVFEAAERGLEEKLDELVRRRTAQRTREDLRSAAKIELGSRRTLATLWVLGVIDDGGDILASLAEEIDLGMPVLPEEGQDFGDAEWLSARWQQLIDLPAEDFDRLVRFAAARFERSPQEIFDSYSGSGGTQAFANTVARELRTQLVEELRVKLQATLLTEGVIALLGAGASGEATS